MTIEEKRFVEKLYDAAIEAVEHVAQANWNNREMAAKLWLKQIRYDDTHKSLEEVQAEVDDE